MFVAMLSSTVVTNALPRIVDRPARQPVRLHLGRGRHLADHDREHPDLGQARRPVQQEGAGPDRPWSSTSRGSLVAVDGTLDGGADRGPGVPGARRRWSDRPGAGRDRLDGHPAGARPLLRLHRARRSPWPRSADRSSAACWSMHRASGGGPPSTSGSRSPLLAFVVLQKTLHLPVVRRRGAHRLPRRRPDRVRCVASLLIWVSLAGNDFAWASGDQPPSWWASGVLLLIAAVYVEVRVAREPMIPIRLFRDRTTSLATFASVMVGVAMFGATVYLSQYFQIARGMSPTQAGLMSIAMVGGLVLSSIVSAGARSPGPAAGSGAWSAAWCWWWSAWPCSARSTRDTSLVVVGGYMFVVGSRPRRLDAEPRPRGAEQRGPGRHRLGQRRGHVLPVHGWLDRRLGPGRAAERSGRRQGLRRPRGAAPPGRRPAEPPDPGPDVAAGAGAGGLRARLRRVDRRAVPGRDAVRAAGPAVRCCSSARFRCARRSTARTRWRWSGEHAPERSSDRRDAAVRGLEHEIGTLLRRIRRGLADRAVQVHPELNATSYMLLATLSEHGARACSRPRRAVRPRQGIGEPPRPPAARARI